MPIYEYRCDQGHTFEVMRRMTDDPLAECLTCAAPVEQVFHPITVHFKGKGFYNTDYGTKKRAREMQESKSSESGKSGDAAKAGDAKPASGEGSGDAKASDAKSSEPKTPAAPAKADAKTPAPAPKKSAD